MTVCNIAALGGSNAAQSSQSLGGRPGGAPLLAGSGAAPFSPIPGVAGVDLAARKVYVWGLAQETTTETFLAFFSQFGEIEEGAVTYDKVTRQSRYGRPPHLWPSGLCPWMHGTAHVTPPSEA